MGYRSEGRAVVIPATDIEFIKARTNTFWAINTKKCGLLIYLLQYLQKLFTIKNYSSYF